MNQCAVVAPPMLRRECMIANMTVDDELVGEWLVLSAAHATSVRYALVRKPTHHLQRD